MISPIFHQGSGMGDQLHRYITVRSLAQRKGYDFGVINPLNFKGKDFMQLDMGKEVPSYIKASMSYWEEKDVRDAQGVDIRSYDPEINFIEDNTLIDGYFEDSKYWDWNLRNIHKWLQVDAISVDTDTCYIGFRGGEYSVIPDLYLPVQYWEQGVKRMLERGIEKFEVHTDDPDSAWGHLGGVLPEDTKYIRDIGINWRTIRYAKHALIANSAFYILPRLLRHQHAGEALTIAPRYWARYNTKTWARPSCFYEEFQYI